ncbi:hypothetical protein H5J22_07405 [Cetobacterium sp. 8H]|uniref:hypothetical protein n=1 Tax=Cetobacterium sp. 8H TaxID=2759681 RepID=UPI00163B7B11|nr:hypothetical protein [Cetobacterium sp. 8H]MBC2851232.1 hypothetical protein [Cetobacterium sp. 8H]
MIKKICVMFLVILTASCSSLENKTRENLINIDSKLNSKLELIQKDLQENNLISLKNSLDVSLKERYMINKLSEYNLSKMKFYFTKPEIIKTTAKNTVGIRSGEEIIYFNLEYKYSNGDWKIIKFTERR